jgi:2-C-methyl-D-erythritol 2,4-cyclodiphosphate synthase
MYRVGIGYDQHRFVENRRLKLGGVEIPFTRGLLGHSDGDALLHSLCNAILGAIGKGDIGEWFPDTDAEYKDADSSILVLRVAKMMKEEGYRMGNIDAMIIAEAPKITPYKKEIRSRIAELLEIEIGQVNIKATRPEGMGVLDGKQGLAAQVIVLLEKE